MYATIAHYPEPVQEFLKADRQWPRRLRIKHAKAQKSRVEMPEQGFWQAVLDANEG